MQIGSTNKTLFQLNQTSKDLNKTFQQLTSGKRINSAGDDPAGLALASALTSAVNELSATNKNLSYESSALQTASGALGGISQNLQQLRDLAVQASNGTLNDTDRANLQNQYDQVLQSIDSTVSQTNFNGNNLGLDSASTSALGVNVTGISSQSSAQDALQTIDDAINQVNSLQANIGASQNANEFSQNANAVQIENLQAAKSTAEDADLAETVSDLAKLSVQRESQIQTLKTQLNLQKQLSDKLFG